MNLSTFLSIKMILSAAQRLPVNLYMPCQGRYDEEKENWLFSSDLEDNYGENNELANDAESLVSETRKRQVWVSASVSNSDFKEF
jgi:hypothetical protein